jgi:hypothetical protein
VGHGGYHTGAPEARLAGSLLRTLNDEVLGLRRVVEDVHLRWLAKFRDDLVDLWIVAAIHQNLAELAWRSLLRDLYVRASEPPPPVAAPRGRAEDGDCRAPWVAEGP